MAYLTGYRFNAISLLKVSVLITWVCVLSFPLASSSGYHKRLITVTPNCRQGQCVCKDGKKCIEFKHICDNHTECPLGDDEVECSKDKDLNQEISISTSSNGACNCPPYNYQCGDNKTCVHVSKMCNGQRECPDGDDETSCPDKCFQ